MAQAFFVRTSGQDGQLQGVEGRAKVPVGRSSDKVQGLIVQLDLKVKAPFLVF